MSMQIQKIKKEKFSDWSEEKKKIFNLFFPSEEREETIVLKVERNNVDKNLKLLSEYAFLIFKNISIEYGLEWKILPRMKEREKLNLK